MGNVEYEGSVDFGEKPQEECGFVAVVSLGREAVKIACEGVTELDNRGRESTGGGVIEKGRVIIQTGFGVGKLVFPDGGSEFSARYPTNKALAHARYGTQGTRSLDGAQPHGYEVAVGDTRLDFMQVHNGNLTNTEEIAIFLGKKKSEYSSDSHLMGFAFASTMEKMLRKAPGEFSLRETVRQTLPAFEGAFTGALMTEDETVVFCDHHGLKPAMIGRLPDGGIELASEVTALDKVNATFIREMEPGEMVTIQNDGTWEAEQWALPEPKGCILELFYFMRTKGQNGTRAVFRGLDVEEARVNAGRALAMQSNVEVDFVFGVPNSAIPVGEGFARQSGVPYNEYAVTANKLDRTFIEPTQEQREAAVRAKLEVNPKEVKGKRVMGVDDSSIRGTTMKAMAEMLFENGAEEVHLGAALPLLKYICKLGVDINNTDDLIAVRMHVDEIKDFMKVNSMDFLSIASVVEYVLKDKADDFCMGCLTGEYPSPTPTVTEVQLRNGRAPIPVHEHLT